MIRVNDIVRLKRDNMILFEDEIQKYSDCFSENDKWVISGVRTYTATDIRTDVSWLEVEVEAFKKDDLDKQICWDMGEGFSNCFIKEVEIL